jgi:hypothetical protein
VTSIFSAISGQFSKSLILGTFLPVVVFLVLGLLLVPPLLPSGSSLLQSLQVLDKEWQVVAVMFFAILLTGLLYNLNTPIVRFYEGYPWKESTIGVWMKRRCQDRYMSAGTLRLRLRFLGNRIQNIDLARARLAKIRDVQQRLALMLNDEFPDKESLILPTRLGNVIRSFEFYSDKQYNMGAINLWPRLISKIDKEYATVVDEAKASFDFMINCSVLSMGAAVLIISTGLFFAAPLETWTRFVSWLVECVGFTLVSSLCYEYSMGRADTWGKQVKSAFDLYRWDLLKQLGYKYNAYTREEERKLWREISQQIVFGDPRQGFPLPYSPQMQVDVDPASIKVDVAKGVSPPTPNGIIVVTIRIRNVDPQKSTAKTVRLSDPLPEDFCYIWDSATVSDGVVTLLRSKPAEFELKDVGPDKDLILSYSAVSLAAPKSINKQ